jgi:hypothetical protein
MFGRWGSDKDLLLQVAEESPLWRRNPRFSQRTRETGHPADEHFPDVPSVSRDPSTAQDDRAWLDGAAEDAPEADSRVPLQ